MNMKPYRRGRENKKTIKNRLDDDVTPRGRNNPAKKKKLKNAKWRRYQINRLNHFVKRFRRIRGPINESDSESESRPVSPQQSPRIQNPVDTEETNEEIIPPNRNTDDNEAAISENRNLKNLHSALEAEVKAEDDAIEALKESGRKYQDVMRTLIKIKRSQELALVEYKKAIVRHYAIQEESGAYTFNDIKKPVREVKAICQYFRKKPSSLFPRLCQYVKGSAYCIKHKLRSKPKFDPVCLTDILNLLQYKFPGRTEVRDYKKYYSTWKSICSTDVNVHPFETIVKKALDKYVSDLESDSDLEDDNEDC